jgi:hypothetical protein
MTEFSTSGDLRINIDRHLLSYESSQGVGADAYCDVPQCHPMADGKYLQTLAVLRSTELISISQFQQRSLRTCARIEANALKSLDGINWGLGFSWRKLSPTEPFLITSAIVTRGLLDCHRLGLISELAMNLLYLGWAGLERWRRDLSIPVGDKDIVLPVYSPSIREPIFNAAAYALGTLKLIDESEDLLPSSSDTLRSIEWIRSRRVAGLGWPYSPTSPVVDLLHQCYILNALADVCGIQSIEQECAEMMGQFAGPCFADAMRLVMHSDEFDNTRDIRWLRPLGDCQVEILPKPARLWSLGELLVLLSRLGLEGKHSAAWARQGRRVAEAIVSRLSAEEDTEARYPRHVMHAVHGLACYLALLRKRAQGITRAEVDT